MGHGIFRVHQGLLGLGDLPGIFQGGGVAQAYLVIFQKAHLLGQNVLPVAGGFRLARQFLQVI